MTNRAMIANTALYDVLLQVANNIDACTIKAFTGKFPKKYRCTKYKCCAACLQEWLNEEAENNENH